MSVGTSNRLLLMAHQAFVNGRSPALPVQDCLKDKAATMLEPFQDKRRLSRIRIALPIRVRGTNCKGIQFEEMTRSIDVNGDGTLFLLNQDLKKGMRLKLSLPLPRSMQKSAASKAVYQTDAVVVRIEVSDDPGSRRVAVRFRSASPKAYYQEAS
jgi:hypothetical protein